MRKRRSEEQSEAEPEVESLVWQETTQEQRTEEEWAVVLHTDRGDVTTRYHPILNATSTHGRDGAGGVIWVGGAGGGLDGPARGLYPEASRHLQRVGIASLRLHYRYPNHLEECVLDTLLGVEFLAEEGIRHTALVGHSFGGAVVITAGALSERVCAVVPMSTQTYGADLAPQVAPRAMLLVHGTHDTVLPDICWRLHGQSCLTRDE